MSKFKIPSREVCIDLCRRAKDRQYESQKGLCWLCAEPMEFGLPQNTYGYVTWEHVIPLSLGGTWELENLRLTHWECNWVRGAQTDENHPRPPIERVIRLSEKAGGGIPLEVLIGSAA